tara:strand:+ start:18 stop:698 length:681 start_codon:yes stop_codon:yes gene_type:complete
MSDSYELNTKLAYQDRDRAKRYRKQHQDGWSWARITMGRELRNVSRALEEFEVGHRAVLDMPCGTGVAGPCFKGGEQVLAMDISREMMLEAQGEYPAGFSGFVQADITRLPLPADFVAGVVVLGFMHRVPLEIKREALRELYRVSSQFVVVSFTIDNALQRLKKGLFSIFKRGHSSAPAPMALSDVRTLATEQGFEVVRVTHVVPFFSAEVMLWLRAKKSCTAAQN